MAQRWTVEAVADAAPDAQVRRAGRQLAVPTPWSDVGVTGTLLFGRCRGSGRDPYQVSVDLAGPRYRCTCPSRKFPCKHAIALLYLWAEGHVDEQGVAPTFAADGDARGARHPAHRPERRGAGEQTPEQAEAALRRAAEREARVDAGVADLERFLTDLVGRGLASDPEARARLLTAQAARLVDAQAPGLAGRLRALALVTDATPRWPEVLTEGLGRVQLLVRAWQHRAALPADLVATVRAHVGFTTRVEDVLARPGVADTWVVVGLRDAEEERVSVRRVWLWGLATGRPALMMFFAAGGATLTSALYPGTSIEATAHFYPGRPALRAAFGDRAEQARPVGPWRPDALTADGARRAWRDALAADPWLEQWPVIVAGRLTAAVDAGFGLQDAAGATLALRGDACWRAAAVTGGRECLVLGELSEAGLLPSAVVLEGELSIL